MAGLDVVVAHGHGVVFHIGDELDEGMLPFGVHVVVVIRRIVALQAVAGIEQEDVLPAHGATQAVHPGVDGHEARLVGLALDVGFVEPVAVDVSGGDDMEDTLLRGAGKREEQGSEKKRDTTVFHNARIY